MKESMRIIITSLVAIVVSLAAAPTTHAQPAAPSPTTPAAGAPAPTVPPAVPPTAVPSATEPSATDLRKICADAMNKNPTFAKDIVAAADKTAQAERDAATVKAHTDAQERIAKNEKHVILAYTAMWLVAAGFVLFLWRRQQALKSEIAQLRRDLDAAAKEPAT
jgi:cell division protein FtsL